MDALEEWASHKISTSGPRAGAENTARKEIPLFMAIRGIKMTAANLEDDESAELSTAGSDEAT